MIENPQNIPAFPGSIKTIHLADKDMIVQEGMTLREWYAGMSLIGYRANSSLNQNDDTNKIAQWCFQDADAMLLARNKK